MHDALLLTAMVEKGVVFADDADEAKNTREYKAYARFQTTTATKSTSLAATSSTMDASPVQMLRQPWSFFFDDGNFSNRSKKASSFLDQMVHLGDFDDIRGFWEYFNSIDRSLCRILELSTLRGRFTLRLFKKTIQPIWEDEANKNGGKWVIRSALPLEDKEAENPQATRQAWFELVLAAVGVRLPFSEHVCGCVWSCRRGRFELHIWVSSKYIVQDGHAQGIRAVLRVPDTMAIVYNTHKECKQRYKDVEKVRTVLRKTYGSKSNSWPKMKKEASQDGDEEQAPYTIPQLPPEYNDVLPSPLSSPLSDLGSHGLPDPCPTSQIPQIACTSPVLESEPSPSSSEPTSPILSSSRSRFLSPESQNSSQDSITLSDISTQTESPENSPASSSRSVASSQSSQTLSLGTLQLSNNSSLRSSPCSSTRSSCSSQTLRSMNYWKMRKMSKSKTIAPVEGDSLHKSKTIAQVERDKNKHSASIAAAIKKKKKEKKKLRILRRKMEAATLDTEAQKAFTRKGTKNRSHTYASQPETPTHPRLTPKPTPTSTTKKTT